MSDFKRQPAKHMLKYVLHGVELFGLSQIFYSPFTIMCVYDAYGVISSDCCFAVDQNEILLNQFLHPQRLGSNGQS